MTKSLVLSLVCAFCSVACVWGDVRIRADRDDAMYRCGERAVFEISVVDGQGGLVRTGVVSVVVDNFGSKVQLREEYLLSSGNPIRIEGSLSEPGFLRVGVTEPGRSTVVSSVGYEPEKIRPVVQPPEDFDEFWTKARRYLAQTVPLDPHVVPLPERSTKNFDLFRVSFATYGGTRVYGYLSVPTNKGKAPFPLEVNVPAAGHGKWIWDFQGSADAMRLQVGVHMFETPFDQAKVDELYRQENESLKSRYGVDYSCAGLSVSCEEYFFYRAILGIDRAIDWVAHRDDCDRRRISYQGTSQGGGFGLILTALNKNISRAVFFVPALTDTLAFKAGRASGWPRPVECHKTEEQKANVERNIPYFDAASFATRITCPVRVAIGLADTTCPPHCTWGTYNVIPSADKKLVYGIGMGHGCRGDFYRALNLWRTCGSGQTAPLALELTFDDNEKDMIDIVAPELTRRGWRGTFGVICEGVGKDGMTWDDIRMLEKMGHEIASHTLTHPNLPKLLTGGRTNEVARQICESRDRLHQELGHPPRRLCLPGNATNDAVDSLIKAAGLVAVSCKRPNFGRETPPGTDKGAYVRLLCAVADGRDALSMMVHGVRKGAGWKAFETPEQFYRHLDEIAELQREGFVTLVSSGED